MENEAKIERPRERPTRPGPALRHRRARNARTHSRKQLRRIADSIRTFGFTDPVPIDRENTILAGHGRVEAARLPRLATVPCLRIEHMTPEQKRAHVIAGTRLAMASGETMRANALNAAWGMSRSALPGEAVI